MAAILRAAGLKVIVHDDHFPQDSKDPEWLAAAGKNKLSVVRLSRLDFYFPAAINEGLSLVTRLAIAASPISQS